MFFSGFILRIDEFTRPVQVAAQILPVTHGIRLLQDLLLRGSIVHPWQVGALATIAAVLLLYELGPAPPRVPPDVSVDRAMTMLETQLRRAARRRWGSALLAFGGVGLVILAVLGFLVIGPLGSVGSAAGTLDDQRTRLVAMLPAAETALNSASTAATNAGVSLKASGQSARDGSILPGPARRRDGRHERRIEGQHPRHRAIRRPR